jgi:hypothetical protein
MIQMHTYIVLFTLLTFSSVAVSAVIQEVLNIAKCIADIHQELPNSCVFIMKSDGEEQGENKFDFFSARLMCFWRNVFSYFTSSNTVSFLGNTFLEIIEYG